MTPWPAGARCGNCSKPFEAHVGTGEPQTRDCPTGSPFGFRPWGAARYGLTPSGKDNWVPPGTVWGPPPFTVQTPTGPMPVVTTQPGWNATVPIDGKDPALAPKKAVADWPARCPRCGRDGSAVLLFSSWDCKHGCFGRKAGVL